MIHSPSTEPFEGKMWFGFWSAKLPADKWLDRGVKFKRSNPTDFFRPKITQLKICNARVSIFKNNVRSSTFF
jgi:hypothetical protein